MWLSHRDLFSIAKSRDTALGLIPSPVYGWATFSHLTDEEARLMAS